MENVAPIREPSVPGTDEELALLLTAIAEKDRQAFEGFYDATSPRVLGLASHITQRRELAEEVVCDVYMQVWENSERYDQSRGTVMAWLMTVCRSRSLDALRREKVRTGDKDRDEALRADVHSGDDDPQELLQAVDRESKVYSALNELDPEQRQLVALAFFRGYTHAEIAEFTAMPLGTVKTQIRRALIALRAYLATGEGLG